MPTQGGNPAAVFRMPAWLPTPPPAAVLRGDRQILAPIADLVVSGWASAPLFAKLAEASPSDAEFIESSQSANTDVYEVQLGPGVTPGPGQRILHYRLEQSPGGVPANVRVELLQGGVVIEAWMHFGVGASWSSFDQVLTSTISDYTALSLRFTTNPVLPDSVYGVAVYGVSKYG